MRTVLQLAHLKSSVKRLSAAAILTLAFPALAAALPPAGRQAAPRQAVKRQKKVLVLAASWCPYCRALEKFLQSRGIYYTHYDIEKSAEGAALYRRHGAPGIPLTIIEKKIIHGFDPAAITRELREP